MNRLLLIVLLAVGCDDIGGGGSSLDAGLNTSHTAVVSSSSGLAEIEVEVDNDVDSFLVTGESDEYLALDAIVDPNGSRAFYWEDWYDSDENLTWALYPMSTDNVVNWPVREADGALQSGTWVVELSTINSNGRYKGNVGIDVTIQRKVDGDWTDGVVDIMVVWAEGVGDEPDVVSATEQAIQRWEEVWAAYGMGIDVTYVDSGVDPDLPYPADDSTDLSSLSAQGTEQDVTVIIGETIEGSSTYYGVAGGIPGALVDVPRSAVAISWLANSGADGVFSDDDIRLYGETLAHEVGHYVGLFHPVEITYDMYDALDDTPTCSSRSKCESELGDNLMFPYPLCGFSTCSAQEELTADQEGVAQRFTGSL